MGDKRCDDCGSEQDVDQGVVELLQKQSQPGLLLRLR